MQWLVASLQRAVVNLHRGVVNMQRGVVTAPRLVAGLHQGKVFLRCPEQRGRREKTCSPRLISLDIQAKTTEQRAKNKIHQATVSKKRSRVTRNKADGLFLFGE